MFVLLINIELYNMTTTIVTLLTSLIFLHLHIVKGITAPSDLRIGQLARQVKLNSVESLPFGVVMKKVSILDLSSSTWPHVFKIPHLPKPPHRKLKKLCNRVPPVQTLYVDIPSHEKTTFGQDLYASLIHKRDAFCDAVAVLDDMYSILLNKTQTRGDQLHDNMQHLTMNRIKEPSEDITFPQWNGYLHKFSRGRHDDRHYDRHRHKRAILGFVGEIAGGFFGLATEDDVNQLAEAVNTLNENQIAVKKEFDVFKGQMLSVLNLHDKRLDTFADTLNKTLDKMQLMARLIRRSHAIQQLETLYDRFFLETTLEAIAEYSVLQNAMTLYLSSIQDRITALGWLNQHYLSPELVGTNDLRKALRRIQPVLQSQYTPFKFAFPNFNYFYSVPSTSYMSDDKYLYVQIKIPLTVLASNYHVYEIFSVPMRASKGQTHYTQLTSLPQYAAFSIQGDTYTTLDQRFLNTCLGIGIKRCSSRIMEVSTAVPSCVLGLFLQDANMTAKYCHTDLIMTNSLAEQALDLGHGKFFLSMNTDGQNWVINCADARPQTIEPCTSCVVNLGCRCNLKTASAFISASLQECQQLTTTSGISKQYVPNLAWITRLQNFTTVNMKRYNMTSRFHDDPAGFLPELPLPDFADVKEYMERDARITTELDTVLQQVQEHKPVYISKVQEFTSRTQWFFLKYHHALPIALAAVSWLLVITVAFVLLTKHHIGIVAIIKQMQSTEAAPLDTSSDSMVIHPQAICIWYIATILTCYIGIQLGKIFYRFFRKRFTEIKHYPRHSTDAVKTEILLKLWTGVRMVILPIDQLCVPNHDLQVKSDERNAVDFKIRSDLWNMRLLANWSTNKLQHKEGLGIPLPIMIKIPRKLNQLVCSILRGESYAAALLLRTGPTQMEHKFAVNIKKTIPKPVPYIPPFHSGFYPERPRFFKAFSPFKRPITKKNPTNSSNTPWKRNHAHYKTKTDKRTKQPPSDLDTHGRQRPSTSAVDWSPKLPKRRRVQPPNTLPGIQTPGPLNESPPSPCPHIRTVLNRFPSDSSSSGSNSPTDPDMQPLSGSLANVVSDKFRLPRPKDPVAKILSKSEGNMDAID